MYIRLTVSILLCLCLIGTGCQENKATLPWGTKNPDRTFAESSTHVAISGDLTSSAIGTLEQAASSSHPLLRANAIEALHNSPDFLEPYVRQGLVDENRGVRFVAAMTVGRITELHGIAHLVEPLLRDESYSVRAAAIFALRKAGREVDLSPLASLLRSHNPEVRANVAMVLGELGDLSATPMIEKAVGVRLDLVSPSQGKLIDLQIAEALVKLGNTEQVDVIRAAMFPQKNHESAALACSILGRLKDKGAVGGLWRLIQADGVMRRPAEVRLAAARALAEMGESVPINVIIEYCGNPQPEIRHQAAAALGFVGSREAIAQLQGMLQDPDPLVQVAVAGAILRAGA